jgi:hypothetical protein
MPPSAVPKSKKRRVISFIIGRYRVYFWKNTCEPSAHRAIAVESVALEADAVCSRNLLRQRKLVSAHPVVRHQDPAAATSLNRMDGVTRECLQDLGYKGMQEAEDNISYLWTFVWREGVACGGAAHTASTDKNRLPIAASRGV